VLSLERLSITEAVILTHPQTGPVFIYHWKALRWDRHAGT